MALRGIYFNDIHTGTDWDLTMNQYKLEPPSVKTNYLEIEGRDGPIDLTEALCDEPKFSARQLELKFILTEGNFDSRNTLLSTIYNTVHGRRITFKDEDHTGYHLEGRFAVEDSGNDLAYGEIEIVGTMNPFWLKDVETSTFTEAGSSKTCNVTNNGRMTVYLTVTTTAKSNIQYEGGSYSLGAGTFELVDLPVKGGETVQFTVTSTGTTTFKWREGQL